jgi:hypothetical protein
VKNLIVNKYIRVITAILLACELGSSALSQTPAINPPVSTQAPDAMTLEAAAEQFLQRNLAVEAARLEVGVAEAERVG